MLRFTLHHRVRNQLRKSFARDFVIACRHRGLEPEDVMLASYPKSGTTWLTFMLAQALWQAGRDQTLIDHRFLPVIGQQRHAEKRLPNGGRIIRTHERIRPTYRKALYVVRDGRDVAVSLYWHVRRVMGMEGEFSDYLPLFLDGSLTGAGAWTQHVNEWLDSSAYASGNVLVVQYDQMKADSHAQVRRATDFLGVPVSDAAIDDAIDAGSMKSMQDRERHSTRVAHLEKGERIPVVRKGVVGDWRNYFSQDDEVRFHEVAGPTMQRLGYDSTPSA